MLKGVCFMNNNEKDTLNSYRQERKERISKQAKKAGKKSNSHEGAKRVIGKICGIVISVVVIVAILAASLNFLGVPQKIIKTITIDGKSYSMSELSCYYMQMFNNVYQYSSAYESQYGSGYGQMLTGYNTALSPTEQTTKDDDGNEITWDEYFLEEAVESMANIKRYYAAAVDAGIELDEDDLKEIQDTLDSINANTGNFSLSRYISLSYGKGVTLKLFKKILTEQKTVEKYQEYRQDELKKGHTDADVEKVYNEDKTAYDVVSVRWYTIDVTSETSSGTSSSEPASGESTSEEATAAAPLEEEYQAQDFIKKVQSQQNYNEETFKNVILETEDPDSENYETYKQDAASLLQKVSKDSVKTNISEDAANWLYEQDKDNNYVRQTGDMKYFVSSDSKTVYILYATGTPFRDTTVPASVRHILVQFPTEAASEDVSGEASTDTEETTVSAETKSECESEAESILNDYKTYIEENESGVSDEDYFGELASKLSDDTGSQGSGGLIEDMNNNGSYVKNFEDWVFSEGDYEGESRKSGDTGIVETEYGYHVMYYVGGHEHPEWYETILDNLIGDEWEDEQKKFEESFAEDAIVRKETVMGWVKKSCLKMIDR